MKTKGDGRSWWGCNGASAPHEPDVQTYIWMVESLCSTTAKVSRCRVELANRARACTNSGTRLEVTKVSARVSPWLFRSVRC